MGSWSPFVRRAYTQRESIFMYGNIKKRLEIFWAASAIVLKKNRLVPEMSYRQFAWIRDSKRNSRSAVRIARERICVGSTKTQELCQKTRSKWDSNYGKKNISRDGLVGSWTATCINSETFFKQTSKKLLFQFTWECKLKKEARCENRTDWICSNYAIRRSQSERSNM